MLFQSKIINVVYYTITVNDTQDKQVWFSVQTDANNTNTVVKDLSTNATAEIKDGVKTGFYYANSGSEITVSIRPGWNLRFTNLPNGTTYKITENAKENYTFVNAAIDNNGTFSVESGTTTGSGKIDKSDTQYTVTYTNKADTQHVVILKTTQDSVTPLPGAVFSLYTENGYTANPKTALKTDLTSGQDGKMDLGVLVCGNYYLVETSAPAGYIPLSSPVEITVTGSGVTYNQSDSSLSQSRNGIKYDASTKVYTLTVTNNAGYELPSTGGPGTLLYTLGGILLMLGAALMSISGLGRFSRAYFLKNNI